MRKNFHKSQLLHFLFPGWGFSFLGLPTFAGNILNNKCFQPQNKPRTRPAFQVGFVAQR
jgi:hypothetical protein